MDQWPAIRVRSSRVAGHSHIMPTDSAFERCPNEALAETRQKNLMERIGRLQNGAAADMFLGSKDASYITDDILSG